MTNATIDLTEVEVLKNKLIDNKISKTIRNGMINQVKKEVLASVFLELRKAGILPKTKKNG